MLILLSIKYLKGFDIFHRIFRKEGDENRMLLDGLSIYALRHELENVIINGIFDGIHQIGVIILLVIRKPGETFQLVISANPQYSRIHLTEKEYDFPDKPSLFA